MHPFQTIAVRAARAAGDYIVRNLDRLGSLEVQEKGRNDLVSEVDVNPLVALPDRAVVVDALIVPKTA